MKKPLSSNVPGDFFADSTCINCNRLLLPGDRMWWSRNRDGLSASEDYCRYFWEKQEESLKLLQQYEFGGVLPGHGERVYLPIPRCSG